MSDYFNRSFSFRQIMMGGACFLLILLWTYAAVAKLADYPHTRQQMMNQVFPRGMSSVLAWLVPVIELLAAGLLVRSRTRYTGLWLSTGLMVVFTGYILLVIAGTFNRVPCSCGGVLTGLSWKAHLLFNLFFLVLAVAALLTGPPGLHQRQHDNT